MKDRDVVIVGAGPAGSWAAHCLAQAGARVAIVDHSHPREKPCGGGVTGRALRLLPETLTRRLDGVAVARAVFDAGGGAASIPLASNGRRGLVVASRESFDRVLLEAALAAGAEHIAERVVDVSEDRNAVRIRTAARTLRASAIVGADGPNSLVRRRFAAPFPRSQLSIAAGWYAHGVTSSDVHIGFVASPAGYIWSFPRPDHLAIGICAQADSATPGALRDHLQLWTQRTAITSPVTLRPYGWPIPSLTPDALRRTAFGGDRWLLAGDAAGFVDPITREGIYFALLSGQHAAASIAGPAGTVSASYRALLDQELLPELHLAARLKAGFFRPEFIALLFEALRGSAAIRCVMADLVAGEQSYRSLTKRLLATGEWRFAARFARLKCRQIVYRAK